MQKNRVLTFQKDKLGKFRKKYRSIFLLILDLIFMIKNLINIYTYSLIRVVNTRILLRTFWEIFGTFSFFAFLTQLKFINFIP